MSSASDRTRPLAAVAAALATAGSAASAQAPAWQPPAADSHAEAGVLRVCADPNNLPFSNAREEGFENRIASLLADDLGLRLSYAWWPQRRGFVRNTLQAGRCDLVMGVPAGDRLLDTTRPYYRSTYVFVTSERRGLDIRSFDDPRLRTLAIGLPSLGTGAAGVPPAQALAARGIVANLHPYGVTGDYGEADPPRRLVDAVARGEVDVALAWGPLAGWFARFEPRPLRLTPVPAVDRAGLPMTFAMAMGVRHGDVQRRAQVEQALDRQQGRIDGILRDYGVPLLPVAATLPTADGTAAVRKE